MNLFAQYEEVGDVNELINYMNTVTYELAEKWITEFTEKISDKQAKELMQDIWTEKKKYFVNHKFKMSKLFYIKKGSR